jgi:hypothetical protein
MSVPGVSSEGPLPSALADEVARINARKLVTASAKAQPRFDAKTAGRYMALRIPTASLNETPARVDAPIAVGGVETLREPCGEPDHGVALHRA